MSERASWVGGVGAWVVSLRRTERSAGASAGCVHTNWRPPTPPPSYPLSCRLERRLFHATFATKDQKEGMDAFVAKRKPVWTHA